MKIIKHTLLLFLLLATASCNRNLMETDIPDQSQCLPEGVPTTLVIPFGGSDLYEVEVSTKSASSEVDESRIHDLYVMIFDKTHLVEGSAKKIYGRYFSYDHLKSSLAEVDSDDNECWFVKNVTLDGSVTQTQGAVKVSTITCADAKLVVIANVDNSVTLMDGEEGLDRLNTILNYDELRGIVVSLKQDVVNRKDLFLMTGERDVNTRQMSWGSIVGETPEYSDHTVTLRPVDAKVKFRIKANSTNISAVTPVYWMVCNTPDCCYLYSDYAGGAAPRSISHFESQQYYFEGTEKVGDDTYYVFTFYMLENRQTPNNNSATNYYQRELREKIDSGDPGYKGPTGTGNEAFSDHFVHNGDWLYAPTFGTYVQFDLILTLTDDGINDIGADDPEGLSITQAMTSDAIFTVHLGDFASSSEGSTSRLNNYQTLRSNSYTYTITINNTKKIYTEVMRDEEEQSGEEGFILLTDTEIINADCHYEYHQIEFVYRPDLSQDQFSWYVKTPFGEGGPRIHKVGGTYTYDASGLDYQWVKFGVNMKVSAGASADGDAEPWNSDTEGLVRPYTKRRHAYPGDTHYDPNWRPGTKVSLDVPCDHDPDRDVPDLMDITQLIEYIFYETKQERETGSSDFIADSRELEDDLKPVIRLTAFIDEYYYDHDPLDPTAPLDPDLWRKFVNAKPREMHILSDAQQSRDRNSDVILSSHSIIQQSIQTIYNIYASNLRSLWGTEHNDEMRSKSQDGWTYWPSGLGGERAGSFKTMVGKENGRLNSAYIWNFYSAQDTSGEDYTRPEIPSASKTKTWETYLNYDVHNSTPELKEDYWGMAFSCLTRNRDNNGDGKVDRDEVRWYLAAPNQLIGMWVGNESLSINARIYRPEKNQWRAHILSSSDKRVCWAEEGGGATEYQYEQNDETWVSFVEAAKGESVRCLRNVGTYDDGGVTRDISGAPYPKEPSRYFQISPEPNNDLTKPDNPSTHYTFYFDYINPKSLREFTENDLPFSDQFSINNCVYLQMETQSREDEQLLVDTAGDVYPDYPYPYHKDLAEVNFEIDRLAMNPYCPPGYRFPNQVEMLLMSVYLPESFFLRDANNTTFASDVWMPTRTYYDRGPFGLNVEGFEYDRQGKTKATRREQCKVGWGYHVNRKKNTSARFDTPYEHTVHYMQRSRCVRDVNRTGDITGGILIKNELYPGDNAPLTFSFNSSGSTFVSASLKFCYTDGTGTYHERDIPIEKTPSGLQFLADQTYSIPSLSTLGLSQAQLDLNDGELRKKTKFKITIRNAYTSKTFEQPFVLGNPLSGTISLRDDGTELYPSDTQTMNLNATSKANTCKLETVTLKLKYKDTSSSNVERTLTIPAASADSLVYKHPNLGVAIPDLTALNLLMADIDPSHRAATLEMTVTDKGGSSRIVTKEVTLDNPLEVVTALSVDATDDKIYPGDTNHATLSVRCKAETLDLTSRSMVLSYDATTIPLTIPALGASVKTYSLSSENLDIPELASLTGIDEPALQVGKSATLLATFQAGDYSKTTQKAVSISHPLAGTITINATDDKIYPGDQNSVTLGFTAHGASLTLASVTAQLYQGDTPVGGTQIINTTSFADPNVYLGQSLYLNIPTLAELAAAGLPTSQDAGTVYTLKATATSSNGMSYTESHNLTLSNPLSGTFSVVGNNEIFPGQNKNMDFLISSQAHTCYLTGATLRLQYKNSLAVDVAPELTIPGDYSGSLTYSHPNQPVYIPDANGLGLQPADIPRYATLELEVTDAGGSSKTYNIVSVNHKHLRLSADGVPNPDYFRIKAKDDGTEVYFKYTSNVSYSTDYGVNWTAYTGQTIQLDADEEVCFKGTRANCSLSGTQQLFTTNGTVDSPKVCYIAGDITSLLNYPASLPDNAFRSAFSNANNPGSLANVTPVTWVDIDPDDPLILPAVTSANCYLEMFAGCTSLTTAPALPATTLAAQCYFRMFHSCSGLTDISEFPSTAVTWSGNRCCYQMFQNCTGIKTLTGSLFSGTSIMGTGCFEDMFAHCTGLTSISEEFLPATTLATDCYRGMFQDTRFTRAPDLPATTLVSECYRYMFNACSQLTYIKCLATTNVNGSGYTTNWVKDVPNKNTSTFVRAGTTAWPSGVNGILSNWNIQDY